MKGKIICATLLVEKSPQALPLGAACVASSIKNQCKDLCVELFSPTKEDSDFLGKSQKEMAQVFVHQLFEKFSQKIDVVCLSVYVWNRQVLEEAGKILKSKGILVIAGGPEITANPRSFSGADFVVSGEGEGSVPALINQALYGENSNINLIIEDCGNTKLAKWEKVFLAKS